MTVIRDEQAELLRDWCAEHGWALQWAAGFACDKPEQPHLCYGKHSSDDAVSVGQLRVLDPVVAARVALRRALPPQATAAFESVDWSALNATDRESDVMTPPVQARWEELVRAVPRELKLRAVRAADGCDLDRCVGADADDAVAEGARCTCYA